MLTFIYSICYLISMALKTCKNDYCPDDCKTCKDAFFETFCMCPLKNEGLTDEIYDEIYDEDDDF